MSPSALRNVPHNGFVPFVVFTGYCSASVCKKPTIDLRSLQTGAYWMFWSCFSWHYWFWKKKETEICIFDLDYQPFTRSSSNHHQKNGCDQLVVFSDKHRDYPLSLLITILVRICCHSNSVCTNNTKEIHSIIIIQQQFKDKRTVWKFIYSASE